MYRVIGAAVVGVALVLAHAPGLAHDQQLPVGGKKLLIKADKEPSKYKFKFKAAKDASIVALHDPAADGAAVLVRGTGILAGKTSMIQLDPAFWKGLGKPAGIKGYVYKDRGGTRGGITKVIYKHGKLSISAKGANWAYSPLGPQDSVWVHFRIEDEWFCAEFGGVVMKNENGVYKAKEALAPGECPEQVCGNGEVELGEECDDGNLEDEDGCSPGCAFSSCIGQDFDSTLEAIQTVIFDNPQYGCTSVVCHGGSPGQGNLDLRAGNAHGNLVGVPSSQTAAAGVVLDRVEPAEPALSYLYEKLAAATLGTATTGGSMPSGGGVQPLTATHLQAVEKWIRGGAPAEGVVEGTAALLGTCLPEPTPLVIPEPDPPPPLEGVQVRQTAWDLPAQSENEICMSTYYDFTAGDLVPEWAKLPCPRHLLHRVCDNDDTQGCQDDSDCLGGASCILFTVCQDDLSIQCSDASDCPSGPCVSNNANNLTSECFAYADLTLFQDPQSHHSFVRIYYGAFDTTDPGWGSWTYKFQDQSNALQGDGCDPTDIDPATGRNEGCSGAVQEAVGCLGAGAPDVSNGLGGGALSGSSTAPSFIGSQEPYFEVVLPTGVYEILPMQGILIWNSHAFNLTSTDSTMSQYLNIDFTADQLFPVQPIFDAGSIFVQDVPPFETREYCRTYTIPQGARLFMLTSHTHRHGVRWRTWLPPNTPCLPNQPACVPKASPPAYFSTDYTDPLQLVFDPPVAYDSPGVADRTFLYCSVFDNGATPTSPEVKRQSTSPEPPLVFGLPVGPGGPCDDSEAACLGGANKGMACGGDDLNCPGSVCDACPLFGGVTTEDEMFILIGAHYLP